MYKKTTTVCRTGQLACAWPDRYATWSNQFNESDKDCPKAKKVSQCIQIEISNYMLTFDIQNLIKLW